MSDKESLQERIARTGPAVNRYLEKRMQKKLSAKDRRRKITCPPNSSKHKQLCHFDAKIRKCVKPNTWAQWQMYYKGSGKTPEDIRRLYNKKKNAKKLKKWSCDFALANGQSHALDLKTIGNPLKFYLNQREVRPLKMYAPRRRQIIEQVRRLTHLSFNFLPKDITRRDIQIIMSAIDQFYFGGTLLRDIRKKGWLVKYTIDKKTERIAMYTSFKTITYNTGKTDRICNFIFCPMAWHKHMSLVVGIVSKSQLESLVIVAEHEMTHAIISIYHKQLDGHPEMFRRMANRCFGHSPNSVICDNTY